MLTLSQLKIAIIGLGYVGLPLAVEFGKHYPTLGFDLKRARIRELKAGYDRTREVSAEQLQQAIQLRYTDDPIEIAPCNFYVVSVPTPINIHKAPDLSLLKTASVMVGQCLSSGNVVVYESTVYPGATEEVCVPLLEIHSGLRYNRDFFVGYSPERINPGDQAHRLTTVVKITSGSTPEAAELVDQAYHSIIPAGTHKTSSLRVAEAAKVIENTQRDVNIALINELALIFNRLGIDTQEVLAAAGTKWNFLPFRPGLVGGHCIGVDPYYLTQKAQEVGYHPEVILAGRRINDSMGHYVATEVIKYMIQKRIHVNGAKILVLGLSFKENCPDLRNSRVIDIIHTLRNYQALVEVYDPHVDPDEAVQEYGLEVLPQLEYHQQYDALIVAVAHQIFVDLSVANFRTLVKSPAVIYDVKGILPDGLIDARL